MPGNQTADDSKAKTSLLPEYKLMLDGDSNTGSIQLPTQIYDPPDITVTEDEQHNVTNVTMDPSTFENADDFAGSTTVKLTATWQRSNDGTVTVQIPREEGNTRETVWRDADGIHIVSDQSNIYNIMQVRAERRFDANGFLAESVVDRTITTAPGWNGIMEPVKGWDGRSVYSDGWNATASLRETYKDGRLASSTFHPFAETHNPIAKTHDLMTTTITVDKDETFDEKAKLLSSHKKLETITNSTDLKQRIELTTRTVTCNKSDGPYVIEDFSSRTYDGKQTHSDRSIFTASDSEGHHVISGSETVTNYNGTTTTTPISPTPTQTISPTPPPKTKGPAAASP